MQLQIKKTKNAGFTIIETMIAISLFVIVVMIGMDTLLNANLLHQKSQNLRSILDSMNFTMEDMSRNIRVGYNYQCIPPLQSYVISAPTPTSGKICGGIAFVSTASNVISTWIYYIAANPKISGNYSIFKTVYDPITGNPTTVQMTPDEVNINSASSFAVLGAPAPASDGTGDLQQPFVTIRMFGNITAKNITTPFSLQTSVSQRKQDI